MNNSFNAKRFQWLLKKTLLERPVQLLGCTALILAVVLILYVFCKTQMGFHAAQNISFIWGFAGGGCFLASFAFSYFNSNASGSSYLTLPASHLEKWLCGIFIAGLMFPAVFVSFFRLMDTIFVGLYHNGLDPSSPSYKAQYAAVYLFPFDGFVANRVYPIFIFLAGSMMLGSLYFNKLSFIKVAIAICAISIGGFALNWFVATLLFGTINDAGPFDHVTLPVGNEDGFIEPSKAVSNLYHYALAYVLPVLPWGISFIRLREKEF